MFKVSGLRYCMQILRFMDMISVVLGIFRPLTIPNTTFIILMKHMYSMQLLKNNMSYQWPRPSIEFTPLIYYSIAISHHCISIAVSVSMAASYVLCPACDMMNGGVVITSHISPDTIWPWSRYYTFTSPLGWLEVCNVDGLVQHYSKFSALAVESPQSCIKPVMWYHRSNGYLDKDLLIISNMNNDAGY